MPLYSFTLNSVSNHAWPLEGLQPSLFYALILCFHFKTQLNANRRHILPISKSFEVIFAWNLLEKFLLLAIQRGIMSRQRNPRGGNIFFPFRYPCCWKFPEAFLRLCPQKHVYSSCVYTSLDVCLLFCDMYSRYLLLYQMRIKLGRGWRRWCWWFWWCW